MKAPIVLAVDTNNLETAQRWIEATRESVSVYKLGLEFFLTFGQTGISSIKSVTDADIFLDLKPHEIHLKYEPLHRLLRSPLIY